VARGFGLGPGNALALGAAGQMECVASVASVVTERKIPAADGGQCFIFARVSHFFGADA